MLDFFESIPFPATTAIAAIMSVAVVAALSRLLPIRALWAAALVVPLMVAYLLYWAPSWLRHDTDTSEYSAWEFLFLTVWGIAGAVASLVLVGFLAKRRTAKSRQSTGHFMTIREDSAKAQLVAGILMALFAILFTAMQLFPLALIAGMPSVMFLWKSRRQSAEKRNVTSSEE